MTSHQNIAPSQLDAQTATNAKAATNAATVAVSVTADFLRVIWRHQAGGLEVRDELLIDRRAAHALAIVDVGDSRNAGVQPRARIVVPSGRGNP